MERSKTYIDGLQEAVRLLADCKCICKKMPHTPTCPIKIRRTLEDSINREFQLLLEKVSGTIVA